MNLSMSTTIRVVVLSVILGAGSGVIAAALTSASLNDYAAQLALVSGPTRLNEQRTPPPPSGLDAALTTVRQSDVSAVVQIFQTTPADGVYERSQASASGTVLTSDGWILSAAAPGTSAALTSARVVLGGEVYPVKEVVADAVTHAVFLKIDGQNLPVMPFGDSSGLTAGQSLFVLPSSSAIVPTSFEQYVYATALAASSDAPTRRLALATPVYGHLLGLAGAPITDANGKMVGLFDPFGAPNLSSQDAADVALPLSAVGSAIRSILSAGKIVRPSLGAVVIDLSRAVGLSDEKARGFTHGAMVDNVVAATPAETAGLKNGDIVLEVSGSTVDGDHPLDEFLSSHNPGDAITLLVDRNGDQQKLSATLVAK